MMLLEVDESRDAYGDEAVAEVWRKKLTAAEGAGLRALRDGGALEGIKQLVKFTIENAIVNSSDRRSVQRAGGALHRHVRLLIIF